MPYTGPRGTGFVSLADYLNLNREASQRMGGELVEDVNKRGAEAQGAIQGYGQQFLGKAAAGTPGYNPEGVTTEEEALKRAEASKYTGPEEWDAAQSRALGTQAADAAQRARMATSDYGRGTLLQQRYAPSSGYTAGAAGLDAFLAGRGMGGRAAEARGKWGELEGMLSGQQAEGQKAVAAGKAAAEKTAGQYRDLAKSLHRTPSTQPLTKPATQVYNPNVYTGTDSQVTPGKKGERPSSPFNETPAGYVEDEYGNLRKKQKPTGGFVSSKR